MKFLLMPIALIFSVSGGAVSKQAITLEMKLSINGKLVSQSTIASVSGETTSIESASEGGNGVSIEVTPTPQNKNEVFTKFVVSEIEEVK